MPDSGPAPDQPPIRQPTLADQHWRASLRTRKADDVRNDMLQAIEKNDAWRFSMLLQLKPDWTQQEDVLRSMIEHNRFEMFRAAAAGDAEWHDSSNLTTLASHAAETGKLDFLKIFVEQYKADIHYYNDEMLRRAAEHGHETVVEYLLQKGADKEAWSGEPLKSAAEHGHLKIVKMLVEAGARISGGYGDALEHAAREGHADVVEYLLAKGADPSAGGQESFMTACRYGRTKVVELFLDHGVEAGVRDNDGVITACENKAFDTARLLLEHGANINAQGGRALRLSAYRGEKEIVEFLLTHDADPNIGFQHETPLIEAVRAGHAGIVRLLLEHGADPSLMDNEAWRVARRDRRRDMQHALIDGARAAREKRRTDKLAEFRGAFPGGYSIDDLRARKGPSGDTGLLLAAESGKFAELITRAKGGSLLPEDLFQPEDRLDSVMSALHRTKTLQQFFDPAFWVDRSGQVTDAFNSLPAGMRARISLDGITAQINRRNIMKKLGGGLNGGGRNGAPRPPKISGH